MDRKRALLFALVATVLVVVCTLSLTIAFGTRGQHLVVPLPNGAADTVKQGSTTATKGVRPFGNAGARYKSLRQAASGVQIVYDLSCSSANGKSHVNLNVRDDGQSYIKFQDDFPPVSLQLGLIVTPGEKHSGVDGHGNPDTLDVFQITYGDVFDFPSKVPIASFNKGGPTAGSPSWDSATGDPYIYLTPQNGWTCSVVENANPSDEFSCPEPETCSADSYDDSCEAAYGGGNSHDWKTDRPCVFRENHQVQFSKKSHSGSVSPRYRNFGDIFAGRCSDFAKNPNPAYSIQCCMNDPPASVVSTGPSCGSSGHNIAFGMSTAISTQHGIIASQISPHKFVGCRSSDGNICASTGSESDAVWVCDSSSGTHETTGDDACFATPPVGVLVDKSAGNNKGQTEVACNFTEDGHFSGCGVGGNPCITTFVCGIPCGADVCPCIGDNLDVLAAVNCTGCKGGSGKYPPDAMVDGCQCSDLRNLVQDLLETSCN